MRTSPDSPKGQYKPESIGAHDQVAETVGRLSQLALDGGAQPSLDASFSALERVELDEHTWIDVVPGWVSGADALFHEMASAAPWMQHWRHMYTQVFQEPRFTAEFDPIVESDVPFLTAIVDALATQYGVRYDSVWMNFYADHTKGTGWHADRPANKPKDAIVPLLSLGAARRFLVKPRDGGKSTVFTPASGDLLVMGGRAQRDWLHSAPKQTKPTGRPPDQLELRLQ